MRDPSVAIGKGTSRSMRKGAPDNYWRMRLSHWLGPSHHWWKIDELAVIFGLRFGPDLLHRGDALAHQFEPRFERGAMIGHLFRVPAPADPEQKAAAGDRVDRGDKLLPFGSDRAGRRDKPPSRSSVIGSPPLQRSRRRTDPSHRSTFWAVRRLAGTVS